MTNVLGFLLTSFQICLLFVFHKTTRATSRGCLFRRLLSSLIVTVACESLILTD